MIVQPDFSPLESRDDIANAVRRILAPLPAFFNPEGSGIRYGVLPGGQGEPTASLETLSRALWGLVPLLAGGGHFAEADRWRHAIVAGTDPSQPGYWGAVGDCDQKQVEQPAIALALVLQPSTFWEPLSAAERARVVDWLYRTNDVDIVDSNWRWFRVLVNAALRKLGEKWSPERLDSDLRRIDEFHLGGGWYRDESRIGDYYIPMAMQYYGLLYATLAKGFDPDRARILKERATLFAKDFLHWFAADGAGIPFGRSLIYRFAQGSFWGALAFADVEALPWGQIKGIWLRHLRWWLSQPIFTETGLITVGYRFLNPAMGESYNSYGSPLWALKAFLPLALPADHPFWQSGEMPMPVRDAISMQSKAGMAVCHDEGSGHVFALNQGQAIEGWPRHCAHKYGKLAYSATFGFGVAADDSPARAGLDCTFALSDDGGRRFRLREKCTEPELTDGVFSSTWRPWQDVEVRTWLVAALPGHLRIHRMRSSRALQSADGGFAIDRHAKGYIELSKQAPAIAVANDTMGSAMINLHGVRRGHVQSHEPWFHLMWFSAHFPVLMGDHDPGETWLVTYATGWLGEWISATLDSEVIGWNLKTSPTGVRVLRDGAKLFELKP
jgi:hypothetical protein